jgi:hypothetical protein
MPRRNDIAKILVMFLAVGIPCAAQQEFDHYVRLQKDGTVDAVELSFLAQCGVPENAEKVFAVNHPSDDGASHWHRRTNLLRGRDEAEMDLFGTAEIRLVDGKPRALNYWSLVMDIGQEWNALVCLDEKGVTRFARAVTMTTPVDGTGKGWTYIQLRRFEYSGKAIATDSYFADRLDHRVARPKLSADEASDLGWNPEGEIAWDVLKSLGLQSKGKGK